MSECFVARFEAFVGKYLEKALCVLKNASLEACTMKKMLEKILP